MKGKEKVTNTLLDNIILFSESDESFYSVRNFMERLIHLYKYFLLFFYLFLFWRVEIQRNSWKRT